MQDPLQQENQQLKGVNEHLKQELETMKSQLNSAIPTSSTIEDVFKNNISLTKQLRESEAQKDDLARRLQISLQTIQELSKERDNSSFLAFKMRTSTSIHLTVPIIQTLLILIIMKI